MALALALLLAAPPAAADALIERALANGSGYDPAQWAYQSELELYYRTETVLHDAFRFGAHKPRRPPFAASRLVAVDPRRTGADRRRVLRTVNTRDSVIIDPTDTSEADADDRPIAYADLRGLIQGKPVRTGATASHVIYRFTADPAKVKQLGSAQFDFDADTVLPPLTGTARVRVQGPHAPYVETVELGYPQAKGNVYAKLRAFSMGLRFAPDPTRGTMLLNGFGMDVSLRTLGLLTIDGAVLNRVGSWRYVGP